MVRSHHMILNFLYHNLLPFFVFVTVLLAEYLDVDARNSVMTFMFIFLGLLGLNRGFCGPLIPILQVSTF